ncbi:conserved hypothetical protein [Hyphomicrobiales bacterium]|nr:conserved hypothetical protein [Hyphomicrobiales bacterium]CAH1699095.1 conserved hypothetical protein [Hyphomicrobiales bacterium]CAI0342884.1 conserved hypothetical protein [Hyphomicrobiales bacterium]
MAGALLLAIGWKAAVQIEVHTDQADDLVAFFERNRFDVATEVMSGVPIVQASTASCRVQVARLSPDGANRDLIQHLFAGQDRSFVVFGGAVYAQQPIFWTVLSYFRSRFLRELGFAERAAAVISVAANSSCNAEQLPWHELSGM